MKKKLLNGTGVEYKYFLFCFSLALIFLYRAFKLDCPDGNLKKAKVQKMYSMILPSQNGAALVDHIFRVFDKDSNGYIDFKVQL